jgi:hypothetical protein
MPSFLAEIHARLGTTSMLYFLVVSLWAYVQFFRKQPIGSSYWGMLVIAEVLVVAQALLGIYLWLVGLQPARTVHFLYGLLIPAMIPAAYFYTKGRGQRAENMIYGTTTIITVGLIIRAIYTAQFSP